MNTYKRNEIESFGMYKSRIRQHKFLAEQALKGRLMHVSKPLVMGVNLITKAPQLLITAAAGQSLVIDGEKQRLRRMRRKDRVQPPRQQRKWLKASRVEYKAEAAVNKMIADHETNMDWQEEQSERNFSERQYED